MHMIGPHIKLGPKTAFDWISYMIGPRFLAGPILEMQSDWIKDLGPSWILGPNAYDWSSHKIGPKNRF